MLLAICLGLYCFVTASATFLLIRENQILNDALAGRDRYIAALNKYSNAMQNLSDEQSKALKGCAELIAAQKAVILAYNPNFEIDLNNLKNKFN